MDSSTSDNSAEQSQEESKCKEVVVQAPINIALVKYWGKRDEVQMLPLNDSISVSINALVATTRVTVGQTVTENTVTVNGRLLASPEECERFQRVVDEFRKIVGGGGAAASSNEKAPTIAEGLRRSRRKRSRSIRKEEEIHVPVPVQQQQPKDWHIKVVSELNFPIAAGLASSAAGFAALAFALGQLFHLDERTVIRLARIGSGSACRSIQTGFVHWHAHRPDTEGQCESLEPATHWPSLRAIILITSNEEKRIGSTRGMRNTVLSSTLLSFRVSDVIPKRVRELTLALRNKNFEQLAAVTMAESNQLHAVCLDTSPPLNYLTPDSHLLMDFVYAFNHTNGTRLAYTFDAGPNCCLLLEQETLPLFKAAFVRCFQFHCEFLAELDDIRLPTPAAAAASPFETQLNNHDQLHGGNGGGKGLEKTAAIKTSSANGYGTTIFPWLVAKPLALRQAILSQVGAGPRLLPLSSFQKPDGVGGGGCSSSSSSPSLSSGGGGH